MKNRAFVSSVVVVFLALACSTSGIVPTDTENQVGATDEPGESDPLPFAGRPETVRPSAELVGEPEIVFDWSEQACDEVTLPDLPARAFRNADGLININLSAHINHRLVGSDFDTLEVDCNPTLTSHMEPDPAKFDFSEWLAATYTLDGQTVYALIHNEYHGDVGASWDSRRDFGDVQDQRDWSYLAWNGSSYQAMTYDAANRRWQGPRPLCQIDGWGVHPDLGCEPALSWRSPFTGNVQINGIYQDGQPDSGDGVTVLIFRDSEQILSHTINPGDGAVYPLDVDVDVAEGDMLYFRVNSGADASFDATQLRVKISRDGDPCPSDERDKCLMSSLTWAVSTDGGATFEHAPAPEHRVANQPYRYQPDGGVYNIWQPSKIVQNPKDGYYYALINSIYAPLNQGGHHNAMCVMRTDNLDDPASWRAWDGQGFNMEFMDPYANPDLDPQESTCKLVSQVGLTYDLTYNTYFDKFIAVGHTQSGVLESGFYYMLSDDLIHWSQLHLLMLADNIHITLKAPFDAYPSLIDHASPSGSFDVTGQDPYLYFSRFNTWPVMDGDLLRVQVHFSMDE